MGEKKNVRNMFSILRVLTYFSKKGVPSMLYLMFATAKGITRVRVFPLREVWSVSIFYEEWVLRIYLQQLTFCIHFDVENVLNILRSVQLKW